MSRNHFEDPRFEAVLHDIQRLRLRALCEGREEEEEEEKKERRRGW